MSQSTELDGKGKGLSQKAELCVVSQGGQWRTEEDSNPRPPDS